MAAKKKAASANSKKTAASAEISPTFSDKQLVAIEALLSGETKTAAAKTAGVNRSTIYGWLADEAFSRELRLYDTERRDASRNALAGVLESAQQALSEALASDSDRVKLEAAKWVFEALGVASPRVKIDVNDVSQQRGVMRLPPELDEQSWNERAAQWMASDEYKQRYDRMKADRDMVEKRIEEGVN